MRTGFAKEILFHTGCVTLEDNMYISNNPSAVRSQKEITDALLILMREHPYNEITVKQILLESKLARKTFYRNFESKDDVLFSLLRCNLEDYFDIVNNARGSVLDTIFEFADKNRELLMLLDKNNMLYVVLQSLNTFSVVMLDNQNKELNPFSKLFDGLDQEYLVALNIGAVWNVISVWVHRGMKQSPENVKKTIAAYLNRLKTVTP